VCNGLGRFRSQLEPADAEIGRRVDAIRQTVIAWRARYAAVGVEVLADLPHSGRPSVIDQPGVVTVMWHPLLAELAVTHWSAACCLVI
jgi:hypothetical protein